MPDLRLSLLVAVLALAFGGASAGRTLVVTPGDRQWSPEQVLAMARPGDTIYFRGGRHVVQQVLFLATPGVTLASFPGEKATLLADNTDAGPLSVLHVAADGITIRDLEIHGGSYYGIHVNADGKPVRDVVIRNSVIAHSGRDGIKTLNADNLLIAQCSIGPTGARDPSNAEGIDSIGSIGVTIRQCYVHDTATNGIYLKGGARNGLIEGCRVENTGQFGGILLGQDTDEQYMRDGTRFEAIDCVARYNVVVNTGAAGLGTYSGRNVRFEHNTLINVAQVGQAAFWIVTNSRDVPAENVTFARNIVMVQSDRPLIFVKDMTGNLASDQNIFYSPRQCYRFRRETTSAESMDDWDIDQWRAHTGCDVNSLTADPLLDPANHRPRSGSPADGYGAFSAAPVLARP